ncbi:MAG: hypothetical protein M0P69_12285 [Bacteroidales bacterium]|nr:hypothetical protein [Bacteroidales bacterium]
MQKRIVVGRDRHPECPLCARKMQELVTKKGNFYACFNMDCMIWIDANDPCVGRWQEMKLEDRPKCPLCSAPLNYFFRSDKFMKMQCPNNGKKHEPFQILRGRVEDFPKEQR